MNRINPRILIAPGPYKECLDSFRVAGAMERGIREVCPAATVALRPLCDGGSGIVRVLTEATNGEIRVATVCGPAWRPVEASFGLLGDGLTAVIESASAAGLTLLAPEERNPMKTTTYGVGQLILAAVDIGAKNIIVGCGDSGTNDCGIGCAAACGVKFLTASGELPRPTAEDLGRLIAFDDKEAAARLAGVSITVACNLSSVLCGEDGTSTIYGPQKGATPSQVEELQNGVRSFVDTFYASRKMDMSFIPGAGGAGGLAASLYGFMGAHLRYSIDVVDKYLNLDEFLTAADIVITGEGRIDDRTATGKVACGVALKAKRYNLPVIAIVGSISQDCADIFYNGIDAVECIAEGPTTLAYSLQHSEELIQRAAERAMRFVFNIRSIT